MKSAITALRIEEKISFEYETFFLATVSASRADIFSKSAEIESKKAIMRELKKRIYELPQQTLNDLYFVEDVLDGCYRMMNDYFLNSTDAVTKFLIEQKRKKDRQP